MVGTVIQTSLGDIHMTSHAVDRLASRFGITTEEELLSVLSVSEMDVLVQGLPADDREGSVYTHLLVRPSCGLEKMVFILGNDVNTPDRHTLLTALTTTLYRGQTFCARLPQTAEEKDVNLGRVSSSIDIRPDVGVPPDVRRMREKLAKLRI